MIKINLAAPKKSSLYSQGGSSSPKSSSSGLMGFRASMGGLLSQGASANSSNKTAVIRAVVALGIVGLMYQMFEDYKIEELAKLDTELQTLSQNMAQYRQVAGQLAAAEAEKKRLEAEKLLIQAKIQASRTLEEQRKEALDRLIALSKGLPNDVWLDQITVENQGIDLTGKSLDYAQVSDFLQRLRESAFFQDLQLTSTEAVKDENGNEIASFKLKQESRRQ